MGLGEYGGFTKADCKCPHNGNIDAYTDAMFVDCMKHGLASPYRKYSCIYEIQTP